MDSPVMYSESNDRTERIAEHDRVLKRRAEEIRERLVQWRPLILMIHSVLQWQRLYDPAIIITVITTFFVFISWSHLSVLTWISLIILFSLFVELALPIILASLFKNDADMTNDGPKFAQICERLACIEQWLKTQWQSLRVLREENPKEYFVLGTIFLIIFAIYGQFISNTSMAYYITLGLSLTPGVLHQRLIPIIYQIFVDGFDRLMAKAFHLSSREKQTNWVKLKKAQ